MKPGDLIKVPDCEPRSDRTDVWGLPCCWFCRVSSNRVGYVLGPSGMDMWECAFDQGVYILGNEEARVINESQ